MQHNVHVTDIETIRKRFWPKVCKGPCEIHDHSQGCYIWIAKTNEKGYGYCNIAYGHFANHKRAHIVAWYLETGSWPEQNVLHNCHVRNCVRFEHLRQGSQWSNIMEAIQRNGGPWGFCAR